MAKKETKETYQESKDLSTSAGQQYDTAIAGSGARADSTASGISDQRAALTGNYNEMMKPPMAFTPTHYSAQSASTRRIDDAALKAMQPALHDFATTGAIDPTREASINDTAAKLKNNGGLSDENIQRIRGNGGYDEFAKTGGYTPEAIANIKAQAISPIGSYATGTRDELARRAAVQGGYAPGFDAASRQLRRDTARNIADTSLNANVGIQEKVNEGRKWGIGGVSGAETQIGTLKERGLESSGALEVQFQDLVSKYKGMGLSLEEANAQAQADIDAQNVSNETNVNMFNAGQANQAGMFNANVDNQGNLFNITNAQDQYARGVSGLQGLESEDAATLEQERDRGAGLLGNKINAQGNILNTRSNLATQPGIGSNIASGIGAAVGLVGPNLIKKIPWFGGGGPGGGNTGRSGEVANNAPLGSGFPIGSDISDRALYDQNR